MNHAHFLDGGFRVAGRGSDINRDKAGIGIAFAVRDVGITVLRGTGILAAGGRMSLFVTPDFGVVFLQLFNLLLLRFV